MLVKRSIQRPAWREFLEITPGSNIFHTPEMFDVFQGAIGYEPQFWATTDDDGTLLALFLPVRITLGNGVLRGLTTRSVCFGSVLANRSTAGLRALDLLLKRYEAEHDKSTLFTELRNVSDLSYAQSILEQNGYEYEDHLNFLNDLTYSRDDLLQNIGSRTRKNIRRGIRREEVAVHDVSDKSLVNEIYVLLEKSYANANVPIPDRSLFHKAFEILHPKGMIKFILARVGDGNAAGSVELVYRDRIYGWYGGMDRDFGKYCPNEMLIWYILRWGAENGFAVYDFGGAGKPDEDYGVRDFKAKFGGELVCFGRNVSVHAPIRTMISRAAYSATQRLPILNPFS